MPRILVVEDNENNRDLLVRRLQRRGYDVITAVDGDAACRIAAEELPDLILMDMHLPVIDGWEATRRIKQAAPTAAIPIIALTADAMRGDRERALNAGCNDYQTKPIDFPELLNKMERLMPRRGAGRDGSFGCDAPTTLPPLAPPF